MSPEGFVIWSRLVILCIVPLFYFAVLELMGKNPFPKKPPKYIRAQLYHYYYTSSNKQNERWAAVIVFKPNIYQMPTVLDPDLYTVNG